MITKQFLSSNNIKMVHIVGAKYYWESFEDVNVLALYTSNDSMDHCQFTYYVKDGILSIMNGISNPVKLCVENIEEVERLVDSYCGANDTVEVMPLYQINFKKS